MPYLRAIRRLIKLPHSALQLAGREKKIVWNKDLLMRAAFFHSLTFWRALYEKHVFRSGSGPRFVHFDIGLKYQCAQNCTLRQAFESHWRDIVTPQYFNLERTRPEMAIITFSAEANYATKTGWAYLHWQYQNVSTMKRDDRHQNKSITYHTILKQAWKSWFMMARRTVPPMGVFLFRTSSCKPKSGSANSR